LRILNVPIPKGEFGLFEDLHGAPSAAAFSAELHRLRGCFLRLWALMRRILRLRFAKPSESQRSRSRFR
jgi:hypothetical protein